MRSIRSIRSNNIIIMFFIILFLLFLSTNIINAENVAIINEINLYQYSHLTPQEIEEDMSRIGVMEVEVLSNERVHIVITEAIYNNVSLSIDDANNILYIQTKFGDNWCNIKDWYYEGSPKKIEVIFGLKISLLQELLGSIKGDYEFNINLTKSNDQN
ncbi:MAG: hypothetical protein ACOCRK_09715 [bacterium]